MSSQLKFAGPGVREDVLSFHRSIEGYEQTPLAELKGLADQLELGSIRIKDESFRFGLNSFKSLGASYAIARTFGLSKLEIANTDVTLVTATDGNHGRAVAWAATRVGARSLIFIPDGADPKRISAIEAEGAEVREGGINYENAIECAISVSKAESHLLIQDTAWDGYEEVPELITQGYFTMVAEALEQSGWKWPSHVFIQAGVGSLAAGVIGAFHSYREKSVPKFVIVEPQGAACVFESAKHGRLITIEGRHETLMACLSCGRASSSAWELLEQTASAFVSCDDETTLNGMRVLSQPTGDDPAVLSGVSGAVTAGLLYELMQDSECSEYRDFLGLGPESNVLLFSTEGPLV